MPGIDFSAALPSASDAPQPMKTLCARCQGQPATAATPTRATAVCASCAALPEVAEFLAAESRWRASEVERAEAARLRYHARALRLQREAEVRDQLLASKRPAASSDSETSIDPIQAALARARARLQKSS